jgi:hypothetical protein
MSEKSKRKGARASVAQKKKAKTKERRKFDEAAEIAAQRLIFDAQYVLDAVLQDQGLTRRALAEILDRAEATISRELDDDSNLTLRTIAKLATALGDEFRVSSRHFERMKAEGKVNERYEVAAAPRPTTVTIPAQHAGFALGSGGGQASRHSVTSSGGHALSSQYATVYGLDPHPVLSINGQVTTLGDVYRLRANLMRIAAEPDPEPQHYPLLLGFQDIQASE